MSARASTDRLLDDTENVEGYTRSSGINTDLGHLETRRQIEKKLLRKLDLRLSFLTLLSLMNYVSLYLFSRSFFLKFPDRQT